MEGLEIPAVGGLVALWPPEVRILPLQPLTKNPIPGSHGVYDASSDPEKRAKWAEAHPGCNWAIACGWDGLIVVDVDCKHGKDGFPWLHEMTGGVEPDTYTVDTPNAGKHFYFKAPKAYGGLHPTPGVEIQGIGAYVVAAGSRITEGEYVANGKPVAPAPRWLIDVLEVESTRKEAVASQRATDFTPSDDVYRLQKALMAIDPDLPYDAWIKVIWAAQSVYGNSDDAYVVTRQWSELGEKWDGRFFDAVWDAFEANKRFDSLAYWATKYPLDRAKLMPAVASKDRAKADSIARNITDNALAVLERDGNEVTDEHRDDLELVGKALAYANFTDTPKRLALPLFAGGGKTLSVVYFLAEVGRGDCRRGVWVATNTREEIDDIVTQLKAAGVPDRLIGRREYGSKNNVTNATAKNYPILFVTHERIKMGDYEHLMRYGGEQRQLIWDEALIATRSVHLSTDAAHADIDKYRLELTKATDWRSAARSDVQVRTLEYFEALLKLFDETSTRSVVQLPEHPGELDLEVYSTPLLEKLANPSSDTALVDREQHMFWFMVQVPDEFTNIVILDASHPIRDLVQMDRSITEVPMKARKNYSAVTIHYAPYNQGKHTLSRITKLTPLLKEVANWINAKDDTVAVYHLPEGDKVDHLPLQLSEYIPPGKPAHYRSWGEAKGVNSMRDIRFGTHVGMIYRDPGELKAAIAGQQRDLAYAVDGHLQWEVQVSEHAEQVYQGISRLRCRKTVEGKALETDFLLFYPSKRIVEMLRQIMPGVTVVDYMPAHWTVEKSRHKAFVEEEVLPYLDTVGYEGTTVNQLRKDLKLDATYPTDSERWRKVRKLLGEALDQRGFEISRQTIQRKV